MRTLAASAVAIFCGLGFGSAADADVTRSAMILACSPSQDVSASCTVKKTDINDPQTNHDMVCWLLKNGVEAEKFDNGLEGIPDHTGVTVTETHGFPSPALWTEFVEGVTFCARNTSIWWNPVAAPPTADDCRTTRSG